VGHAGGLDKAATIEKAEMLNQRLKAFRTDKHKGTLGKEFSFVSSNNRNVIIKALKKAENSDEYVVRVYEMGGEKVQDAVLSFAGEIASACEADGTEKSIGSAEFSGNGLSVSIKPYSVKTFKVRLKSSGEDAYQLQYASLSLSYNYKCSSFNEFRGEADFESGYSFAAELLPESLAVNGIPFQLGEKDAANGMTCNGDTIVLPEGKKYNKLYFLAAATDGDYAATFRCGGNKSEVIVPSYTGFVGQWGHSGHTKGYLKDAEVAYVGTHRHSPTADEAYEFTYMFKFGVDIPAGAASLILPKNEKVVLFAATLVEETLKPVQVATSLFHTAIRDNEMELNSVEVEKENLLKGAKIIAYSGYFNDNEKPERIVDGDVDTKWCEVGSALNYVDFDLGEAKTVSGWKLVNAGREDKGYITSACFLQGRNSQTEEWKTLDNIDGNRQNVVSRMIDTPAQVRYVRLMITRPMQHAGGKVLRINEMEIY
jgi:alpha-mannosidase